MPINSVATLKTLFKTSMSDRRLLVKEAEKLVDSVKKDGVSGSERRQLRELVLANEDKFEPAAAKRLQDFIANEIPTLLVDEQVVGAAAGRTNLADPKLASGD